MLVDEAQAVELTRGQPRNPLRDNVVVRWAIRPAGRVMHARRLLPINCHPAQQSWHSRATSPALCLRHLSVFS